MTPQAESRVEKPDTDTYCPATGNKLRLKDLIPVKFTKVPTDSESEGRFMDPVTKVRGCGDGRMNEEAGSRRSTPDGFRFRGACVDSHEGCESEVGKGEGRVAGEVNRVWGEDEVYNGVIIQIFKYTNDDEI